jgi:hypothetical protein
MLEPHVGEFLLAVDLLKHYLCRLSRCNHIRNRWYCNADIDSVTLNEMFSMTRCQRNQYSKHSLLYEGQFLDFQNIMKYVLFQLSMPNLVSWPTSY